MKQFNNRYLIGISYLSLISEGLLAKLSSIKVQKLLKYTHVSAEGISRINSRSIN